MVTPHLEGPAGLVADSMAGLTGSRLGTGLEDRGTRTMGLRGEAAARIAVEAATALGVAAKVVTVWTVAGGWELTSSSSSTSRLMALHRFT